MEQIPRTDNPSSVSANISTTEDGVEVSIAQERRWHFATVEQAQKYFRRQHFQFRALRLGMQLLVLAGIAEVLHGVDQTIHTHDIATGAGAVAVSGLVLIVQGLNQRTVGERLRMHKEAIRRVGDRLRESQS